MFWEGHGYSVGRCRKTFSLMKRFFTMLRFVQNDTLCFLLTIRNLIIGGFFLKRKDFFSWIAFLSKLSWRNSFALKRCGEGWRMRGASISITKFTEMWWNDCVFESSEEHRKCSGKVTDIRLAGVEKLFPWWKDSSLRCA